MKNVRCYSKEKRSKLEKCNICGEIAPLTWDHVPPKFCFNDSRTQYNSLFELSQGKQYTRVSQNGIKYRSICSKCNNTLLGSIYDKEYQKLVKTLHDIYMSPGEISQYIEIEGLEINKITRAIIGHLLAARNNYLNSESENALRRYFLNPNLKPPDEFKLLYYVYPYNTIMITRDFVAKKIGNPEYAIPEGVISCINTFPIAFILVHNCECTAELNDLFEVCTQNINEKKNIKIDLLSYMYKNKFEARHPYWPCNISDEKTGTSMLLIGDSANSSVFSQIRNLS